MPHRVLIALLVAVLGTGVAGAAERAFGAPLTPGLAATAIATILEDPEAWAGQRVRIEGRVSGVCQHQGCWIELVSADDASLRVKVEDGVIVFPSDAVGQPATAEGEVEILDLTREDYAARLRHRAEEEGREFDSAEVGEGPYRIVRLRGLGAVVGGP